ncbi:MAG: phosphoribosylformylglycinamidine cyclo-ligase [Planctomycetota bacterium]|jgi:phosphoribosylformylglycinamidine cyclo-ligase|nr:phosphoribosylformylglycinamidine cyclo-ligase [Planctomycetota bacterium]
MSGKTGKGLSYKDSGVDIEAANQLEGGYFKLIQSTLIPGAIRNDGGYGGLLRLQGAVGPSGKRWRDPVLVSGTDGVGSKLKIAFSLRRHDTVGIDLVAMSVNDILVHGAEPLFFLDYIGIGKADKRTLLEIVKGTAAGCRQAGCALLGGETAELPGFYAKGEYDLAGFAVGAVERSRLIDGSRVEPGDIIIGLPSSGLHSNGYSLARKALLDKAGLKLGRRVPALDRTLGEELLRPTRIYVKPILSLLARFRAPHPVHAMAHITGGGIVENVPRVIPADCDAVFNSGAWTVPPIFRLIQETGGVDESEMYRVFNMGLGMIIVTAPKAAEAALAKLAKAGCRGLAVGRIVKGRGLARLA